MKPRAYDHTITIRRWVATIYYVDESRSPITATVVGPCASVAEYEAQQKDSTIKRVVVRQELMP